MDLDGIRNRLQASVRAREERLTIPPCDIEFVSVEQFGNRGPYIRAALNEHHVLLSRTVARRRVAELQRKARNQSGEIGRNLREHALGALGELFASIVSGIPWHAGVNDYKRKPDLGLYDVRTRKGHDSYIIVREGDPDDRGVIAVTIDGSGARCYGLRAYGELKRGEWYGDRSKDGNMKPCFWVPKGEFVLPDSWIERIKEGDDERDKGSAVPV